jgi:hypothetical protein
MRDMIPICSRPTSSSTSGSMYGTTMPMRPTRPSAIARSTTSKVPSGCHDESASASFTDVIESSHALTSNTTNSTSANTSRLPTTPQPGARNSSSAHQRRSYHWRRSPIPPGRRAPSASVAAT